MTDDRRQKRVMFLISAVLVAATLTAYEPIRRNDFVNYDDDRYITKNPNINGGITRQSVTWAFAQAHSDMWHPLTSISHILDCQFFGLNPFRHHLVSLLFHIVNVLLVFWILNGLTGAIWPSAFVAAVFALHPLQVESVAWAAERKTVLSGLFWLLTIAAYIHYTKQPRPGRYALLLLVYGLCIMTKPVVVTLPLVLLLLDYWPLGRFKWGRQVEGTPKKKDRQETSAWRLIIEKIPLLALSAILSVITFVTSQHGGTVAQLEKMPLDYRIANMFVSYIRYIGKILWPSRLAVFYPQSPTLTTAPVVICALLFILLSVFSIYIGRRKRYTAMGWLWYAGTLVPVIGLVQAGAQAMANRYMYLPMLGLLIIIAWAVKDLIANRPRWKVVAAVLTIGALSILLILTRTQVRHWQNSITLFEYVLKVTENNTLAENNYGCALFEAGRLDEAVPYLSSALRRVPTLAEARINLGKVFLNKGKLGEAIECFNELLQQNVDTAEVRYNLAVALGTQKKYDEAIKHLAKVLELAPNYPNARKSMVAVLLAAGRADEAISQLNKALRTSDNPAEVYAGLGAVYNQLGKYEQAIQSWNKAAELKPNRADILNALAWILATVGDVSAEDANRAVEFAHRACELTGYRELATLDTLAAAYAAAGRFNDAVATAQRATDAAKANGRDELAGEIQKRLELYLAGQPYRQKRMTDDR